MISDKKRKKWGHRTFFLLHVKIGKFTTVSIIKISLSEYLYTSPYFSKLKKTNQTRIW